MGGQSLVQIYVHLVFSTKNRAPFLRDLKLRTDLHAYLAGALNDQGSPAIEVGGVEDHVHCLCRLAKTLDVSTLVAELKRESSKWVKEVAPRLSDFYWQNGYGAFSISPSHLDRLIQYIRNQEDHHRKESFQDEFRRLCRIYKSPLNELYVWD
jgi:REP element-mobilizing transposase RayT